MVFAQAAGPCTALNRNRLLQSRRSGTLRRMEVPYSSDFAVHNKMRSTSARPVQVFVVVATAALAVASSASRACVQVLVLHTAIA